MKDKENIIDKLNKWKKFILDFLNKLYLKKK